MATRATHTEIVDGKPIVLIGNTTKLGSFFTGLTPDSEVPPTVVTATIPASSVRQYPGDSSRFSRSAHTAKIAKDRGKPGSTLPGNPFTCEVTTGVGPLAVTDVTQFTLVGTFRRLKDYARANAARDFVLRSPGGKAYVIEAP